MFFPFPFYRIDRYKLISIPFALLCGKIVILPFQEMFGLQVCVPRRHIGVDVNSVAQYELKKIDNDYFIEE
jgi:hypothetical protein